jgi:hypothetical protein
MKSPLPGGRVSRSSAFVSRGGTGLFPPMGYERSGRTTRYGLQSGEGSVPHIKSSHHEPVRQQAGEENQGS